MTTHQIGLDAWIVQDGNYTDFAVGESRKFALKLHSYTLKPSPVKSASMSLIGPARYAIHASVEFMQPDAWVADFGLRAYCEQPLAPEVSVGNWLESEVYLGVDPFMYFERHCKLPGMPALTYDWKIRGILLETTPWITEGTTSFRDKAKKSHKAVTKTNAWDDDDGCASYVLECECLGPA